MAPPRKAMRDIKTHSGRVDRIASPYLAYMQITCLEMEKARKGREKESAQKRLQDLDARLDNIEREKASLLHALTERGAARAATSSLGVLPASNPSAAGVKLRY